MKRTHGDNCSRMNLLELRKSGPHERLPDGMNGISHVTFKPHDVLMRMLFLQMICPCEGGMFNHHSKHLLISWQEVGDDFQPLPHHLLSGQLSKETWTAVKSYPKAKHGARRYRNEAHLVAPGYQTHTGRVNREVPHTVGTPSLWVRGCFRSLCFFCV